MVFAVVAGRRLLVCCFVSGKPLDQRSQIIAKHKRAATALYSPGVIAS
jgi:hypothetical protein